MSLNPRYCWVDTWAFERLLAQAEVAARRAPADARALTELVQSTEKALTLYPGSFLGGDDAQPWTTSLRERLRGRLLRHLEAVGGHCERAGQLAQAVTCYQKGLEVDDCAEQLYRRLMLVYQRLGQQGEALAVYERCRKILVALLGVEPSPQTEAVRQALRS